MLPKWADFQKFDSFLQFFFSQTKNGNGMHQQPQQQQFTDKMALQGNIYSQQQQQQQQLENPTEANVLLQDPNVKFFAVSTNYLKNNVCLSPIGEILSCTLFIGADCTGEHNETPAESSASPWNASLVSWWQFSFSLTPFVTKLLVFLVSLLLFFYFDHFLYWIDSCCLVV